MLPETERWLEWNRRVLALAAVAVAAWIALGLFVELRGPVKDPWPALVGVLGAAPIFAAIWPLRFSSAEWNGFLLPQAAVFLLLWLGIELF